MSRDVSTLGHYQVHIPYKENFSFPGNCYLIFLFLIGLFEKIVEVCFSDSNVEERIEQPDGCCNVTSDTKRLYKLFKTQPFVYANTYEMYNVDKEHCIAHHNDKMCFLPNCRYQNVPKRDKKELLLTLDALSFNYQHVDCLYTLFKYRFSGKIVVKSGQFFDNVQRAFHFNQQNRRVDRMPRIAEKKLLRK